MEMAKRVADVANGLTNRLPIAPEDVDLRLLADFFWAIGETPHFYITKKRRKKSPRSSAMSETTPSPEQLIADYQAAFVLASGKGPPKITYADGWFVFRTMFKGSRMSRREIRGATRRLATRAPVQEPTDD